MVSEGTFNNNTPGAGSVSWVSAKVVYNGNEYTITNSNTSNKFVYWQLSSPTVFATSATLPVLGNNDFLVLINTSGTHLLSWNSTVVDGSRITTGSVTATNIAASAITANEIAASTITAAKIAAGTITANEIAASTITAANIAASTITATEIAANTITGNKLVANTITATQLSTSILYAGEIALDTAGKIRSGQTAFNTGT